MTYKEFLEKYEKKQVEHYPNQVGKNPMVSVCVMTYQHANYIEECLEGILKQKTNFTFEILIGEDGSNDGTREICLNYARKYPDRIRLFLHHRENNIHYAGSPSGKFNFVYNLFQSEGKYIALCEGDDYWTNPFKLQKQVDILENKTSLVMSTHETNHIYYPLERNRTWRRCLSIFYWDFKLYGVLRIVELIRYFFFDKNQFWLEDRSHLNQTRKEIIKLQDLSNGKWFMSLCSIVFKKNIINPLPICYLDTNGGHQLTLLLGAMNGGIYHFKDKMAVKRDQETSISMDKLRKKRIQVESMNVNTDNRIRRFNCLKEYANPSQKEIFDKMIRGYIKKGLEKSKK